jgi:hypothetical protein
MQQSRVTFHCRSGFTACIFARRLPCADSAVEVRVLFVGRLSRAALVAFIVVLASGIYNA